MNVRDITNVRIRHYPHDCDGRCDSEQQQFGQWRTLLFLPPLKGGACPTGSRSGENPRDKGSPTAGFWVWLFDEIFFKVVD